MNYTVDIVYNKIDKTLRENIIKLWCSHSLLTEQQAYNRVNEVVTVGYDNSNNIIGVATAYSEFFKPLNGYYFFYRMFIKPTFRHRIIRRHTDGFLTETFNHLKINSENHNGMITILENTKISDIIMSDIFEFNYHGLNENNLKIWYKNF